MKGAAFKSILWGTQGPPANSILYLKFDGTDGSQTFIDSSPHTKTIAVTGQTKISTTWHQTGLASGYWDGNTDRLEINSLSAYLSEFDVAGDNFEISAYIHPTGYPNAQNYIVAKRNTSGFTPYAIQIGSDAKLEFFGTKTNGVWDYDMYTTETIPLNETTFIQCGRSGDTFYIKLNGTQVASTTLSGALLDTPNQPLYIGQWSAINNLCYQGYMDEFLMTRG